MKTVIIERNAYGRGVHRFHAGFLDYAKHAGFLPRLCHPYRAQTKGKVERFIGYLKGSFWVPFVASMRQAGLRPDKHAANAAVTRWLREVANARVHATTGEIPAARLLLETPWLQSLPAPYGGRSARSERHRRRARRSSATNIRWRSTTSCSSEVLRELPPARAHRGAGRGAAPGSTPAPPPRSTASTGSTSATGASSNGGSADSPARVRSEPPAATKPAPAPRPPTRQQWVPDCGEDWFRTRDDSNRGGIGERQHSHPAALRQAASGPAVRPPVVPPRDAVDHDGVGVVVDGGTGTGCGGMHAGWIVHGRGGVGVLGQRCEPLLGCARVGRRCGWSGAGDAISLVRTRAARGAGNRPAP